MSDSSFDRRHFLSSSLIAGAAAFGPLSKSLAAGRQVSCPEIRYPAKGMTMKMDDIGEIGKLDALILGYQVIEAQNAYAGDEILNEVVRLGGLPDDPVNLLQKALKAATLVQREAKHDKLKNHWIAAALCKDIGRIKAPSNPSAFAAAVLKPYLDDSVYRVLKSYAAFEAHPAEFSNYPWYPQALRFLDWNQRAVSDDFAPGSFESFAKIVKKLVHVGVLFGHPPDSKVIPTLES